MALPVKQQATIWGIATAVFFLLMWFLGQVLLPFVVGGAIAYCLDPLADKLERRGLSRITATVVIFAIVVLLGILTLVLVLPLLISQIIALVQTAPDLYETVRGFTADQFPSLFNEQSVVRQAVADILASARSQIGSVMSSVLSSATSALNGLVVLVVSPVVAFYLLLDWDRMTAAIDELLPRDHAPVIRRLAADIDKTLASFVRGQGTVCLILGTFYAIALMLVGLQFGLVVGLTAGLLTFIPYVGAMVGGVLSVGLALFQFWGQWGWIIAVAAIFVIGQAVEGNILTPNLVGSSVGLHPVWLLFALAAFGSLFGFVGMLVAVPMAAMIGVLVRYGLSQYREGRLYKGLEAAGQDDDS
ncbi:AI-2E family transporter [Nioella nitratireducens]|uniref:AI-2E family transporter n=1 Tax=Nioella nitratireducens TaxID=1287720 RepID=UPI0008FD56D8|nr:AI-2E family transporter [Nioella nitratireducens]